MKLQLSTDTVQGTHKNANRILQRNVYICLITTCGLQTCNQHCAIHRPMLTIKKLLGKHTIKTWHPTLTTQR